MKVWFQNLLCAMGVVFLLAACGESNRQYEDRMTLGDGESDASVVESNRLPTHECPPEHQCYDRTVGRDGDSAWDLEHDDHDGVCLDEQADALILETSSIVSYYIWVANTGEGSVSKIDVRTYEEVGRYLVGNDPSRTSVNTMGDAYVGNRAGRSLVKISALGEECPDTNGDGVITTSTGHEMLEFGQDDCVLWRTDLSHPTHCGLIRAVAAQDVPGPDGELYPFVWVGGDGGCIWKLDGVTGRILIDATPAPVAPYGFAMDAEGNLWIEAVGGRELGRLDTNRCRDQASCPPVACDDDRGDFCIMQRIEQPVRGYGITVDSSQRVWVGGYVARYDPSLPRRDRWTVVDTEDFVHGIAADNRGWVWGAAFDTVLRFDAEEPWDYSPIRSAGGRSAKGAAVDDLGQVWIINQRHSDATVIIPGRNPGEMVVRSEVAPVFASPYIYSDMTGSQLRLATRSHAYYRHVFQGCPWQDTTWEYLEFDAFLPRGAQITIRARTADSREALEAMPWVTVATAPPTESPGDLLTAFEEAMVTSGYYLEIELQLATERTSEEHSITPEVFSITAHHRCYAYFG